MPHITTNRNIDWHYESYGEGEDLLFLHGFGLSGYLWSEQIEFFNKHFKVTVLDLPGHGGSSWQEVDLDGLANDISFILDKLEMHQVNFVGSSFGGMIAMKLLQVCPYKVQRMVFVGGLPKFARSENYPAGLDIERIRKLSGQFDGDYIAILEIFFRSLFSRKDRDDEQFKKVRQLYKEHPKPVRECLKHFLEILEKEDLRDMLININCRVQFINGTEDYICPPESIEWLQEVLPYANFENIEGAGHLPFLSRPKEFNDTLDNFLMG